MLYEAHRHLFCTGVVLQRNWFSFRNKVVWVWSSYKQSVLIVVFLFRPVVLCRYNNNKLHTFCFHWNIKELFLTMYFSFLHLYHFQKHCCRSTLFGWIHRHQYTLQLFEWQVWDEGRVWILWEITESWCCSHASNDIFLIFNIWSIHSEKK